MVAGKEAPTPGEGKNAWLTGTAAWTFLSISQGILGIVLEFDGLRIDPCIPAGWSGFHATRVFRGATYDITVRNPHGLSKGVVSLLVDGKKISGCVAPPAAPGTTVVVEAELG